MPPLYDSLLSRNGTFHNMKKCVKYQKFMLTKAIFFIFYLTDFEKMPCVASADSTSETFLFS